MKLTYILNKDGKPVAEPDTIKWAIWFESYKRQICFDQVGPSEVSTIFTGVNYNYFDGPPVLWETMIFGGELDKRMMRCAGSREQAEAMHAQVLQEVKDCYQKAMERAAGYANSPKEK